MTADNKPAVCEQEWKEGWKVVWAGLDGDRNLSCSPMAAQVDYKPGEETRRPKGCGPLTVFSSSELASDFRRMWAADYWLVLRCRYLPSSDKAVWNVGGIHQQGHRRHLCDLPQGTVLADAVIVEKTE